jgi:hypothetical protein
MLMRRDFCFLCVFRSQILLYFAIVNKSGKNVRARADVTRDSHALPHPLNAYHKHPLNDTNRISQR